MISPPMSPEEQLYMIQMHEETLKKTQTQPSHRDREVSEQFATYTEQFAVHIWQQMVQSLFWPLTSTAQRYMHYIASGINVSEVPPLSHEQMTRIRRLLPPDGERAKNLQIMKKNLEEKVQQYYYFSFKKSIGNEENTTKLLLHCPMFHYTYMHIFVPLQSTMSCWTLLNERDWPYTVSQRPFLREWSVHRYRGKLCTRTIAHG